MAPPSKNETRPIIIRKVRKSGHAAHHGGAWKVAYADFVTAMMAFFMLLWLVSNPDKTQLKGLAEYFTPFTPSRGTPTAPPVPTRGAGDTPGMGGRTRRAQAADEKPQGTPSVESAMNGSRRGGTAAVPDAALRVLAQELRVVIDSSVDVPDAHDNIVIEPSREGLRISLMDTDKRSMFRSGTATLNAFAVEMLDRVSAKLAKTGMQVAIEGHTDNSGGQSAANWRLSADRALAARSAMVAAGLDPDRFDEVVAMAGSHPVYPGQPDRPENRRITIVALTAASPLPSDASFSF
jgi:chemotaxis protein MotB